MIKLPHKLYNEVNTQNFIRLKNLPQIPHTPCTALAPTGSSTAHLSNSGIEIHVRTAPIAPISIASHARYKKQPAVIDTNDPRMPLIKSMISTRPLFLIME